ncbi:unnamed protein product [Ilex paraguariensis]|uniref:Uncharacterized protein n=1 Tax=Ilex paraguariensis TaxID=185542 RepID=A0ABC8SCF6_9AQUA
MDRMRPVHVRQKSVTGTTPTGASLSSPMASPLHGHARSGSASIAVNMKKPQNTKAAAQRLAQVMAHQLDNDEDEDDLLYDYSPANASAGIGLAGGRGTRPRSPLSARTSMERPSVRSASGSRAPLSVNSVEQPSVPLSTSVTRSSQANYGERPPSARSVVAGHSPQYFSNSVEQEQPSSARSYSAGGSAQSTNATEQPSSAHSTSASRPNLGIKTVPMVPPSVPLSLKPAASGIPVEAQPDHRKDKRLSLDFGTFKYKDDSNQHSSSALQDELDMLQEENESLLEKLRLAEERGEEAEARARLLEKQVATLGEGVSLEARLLSRKEAALQQREAHDLRVCQKCTSDIMHLTFLTQ